MMSTILSSTVFPPLATAPTKRSTKISTGSRITSFSGLRGQDFNFKAVISIPSQRGRGGKCVAKAGLGKFTENSMEVLALADKEARNLGHDLIGKEEILLGLIAEGSNIAANVLRSMGINLKDTRHKYTGPEHLLLGLLRETQGVATARILENLGADLRKIEKEVNRKIAEGKAASS
ncbi:hypothetical protein J1N35_027046 [Gossypium stocksii]|uniref:Clp R domain-containing protein n=1 Tax=Gossypium stocksii TaxID=47602 RepID=A0A9D3ZZT8_9ROSI|nr:hypothetical protein J1N35_027046 [Gossypium stocksii]